MVTRTRCVWRVAFRFGRVLGMFSSCVEGQIWIERRAHREWRGECRWGHVRAEENGPDSGLGHILTLSSPRMDEGRGIVTRADLKSWDEIGLGLVTAVDGG